MNRKECSIRRYSSRLIGKVKMRSVRTISREVFDMRFYILRFAIDEKFSIENQKLKIENQITPQRLYAKHPTGMMI